jgi:membrane protease YdiL (CAAX protease family)
MSPTTHGMHGELRDKPGAWVDLGLTLPIFVAYHAGVIFLHVQNATDPVTGPLLRISEGNRAVYLLITASIGVVFAAVFGIIGRGQAFRPQKFVQIAVEGVLYAFLMRLGAAYVVGHLFAMIGGPGGASSAPSPLPAASPTPFVGLVMSLGAGFYEELAFRVLLFGLGAKVLVWLLAHQPYGVVSDEPRRLTFRGIAVALVWAVASATIFSGVHYVGALGDSFALPSFVFRIVLGLVLTVIFVLRGFAAAVWAHALYDIWVLVLPGS